MFRAVFMMGWAEDWAALRIHDISPPVDLPLGLTFWMALAGGPALLALGGVVYWRQRRAARAVGGLSPSADELALQRLERLLAEGLPERGDPKRFYEQVTEVLRQYLEGRFGLRAPEWTTREFLVAVRQDLRLAPHQKELLKAFLTHCDLVKFAQHQPTPEDMGNIFACCRQFIEETRDAL